MNAGVYSSATDDWATPQDFFDRLNAEFGFTVDVCASPQNAKVARYHPPEADGLAQDWTGETAFCNPPYGREIGRWMLKAAESAEGGATVVCLVPARTDTRWWCASVWGRASEVRFVLGRLRFGAGLDNAPFPSAVVVYRPDFKGETRCRPWGR